MDYQIYFCAVFFRKNVYKKFKFWLKVLGTKQTKNGHKVSLVDADPPFPILENAGYSQAAILGRATTKYPHLSENHGT